LRHIKHFIKNETVLTAALLLAIISAFIVPPDRSYIDYLNLPVLALLFCLMAVVAGLRKEGLFDRLSDIVTRRIKNTRSQAAALCAVCFFTSMLITNDVALITFVPFTIMLMRGQSEKRLIFTVVMETVAANLGSLVTPIGNPQNLFLYTYYSLSIGEFLRISLPLGGVCLVLIALTLLFIKGGEAVSQEASGSVKLRKLPMAVYGGLFLVCILTVLDVLPYWACLAVVALTLLIYDRQVFKRVDYVLLITFVCFFVFVGNMSRIEAVKTFTTGILQGRELIVAALLSQIISNVPAATMLAPFTENYRELILGVNIGGLGTMIASMASLISYRFYCARQNPDRKRYFAVFSLLNFILLALLIALSYVIF
jgi:Na+/H+ antiporter NhaD/arsenite permease-like protein